MPKDPSLNPNNSPQPTLTASWSAGPRNPAWDALWRRLLGEAIGPTLAQSPLTPADQSGSGNSVA